MGIFSSGVSKGAYQGRLTCPHAVYDDVTGEVEQCGSTAIRFVEEINPVRLRYRCRKCGRFFQYDISIYVEANPYAAYRKGRIWKDIQRVSHGSIIK